MGLILYSNESLDKLETIAHEYFNQISDKGKGLLDYKDFEPKPFLPENLGKVVKILPIKDNDSLNIKFILRQDVDNMKYKPSHY